MRLAGEEVEHDVAVGEVPDLRPIGGGQATDDREERGRPCPALRRREAARSPRWARRTGRVGRAPRCTARPCRMISSEFASHASEVSPQAVIPWPPRIAPIALRVRPLDLRDVEARAGSPGRRHGTQATRSPKQARVRASPSAAVANAIPLSGWRWSTWARLDQPVHRRVDRWRRAAPAVEAVVERGDHLVLALDARVDVDHRPQPVEPEHRQAGLGERPEIAAGALDPQQLGRPAGHRIDDRSLGRRVAAGVVRVARVRTQPVRALDELLRRGPWSVVMAGSMPRVSNGFNHLVDISIDVPVRSEPQPRRTRPHRSKGARDHPADPRRRVRRRAPAAHRADRRGAWPRPRRRAQPHVRRVGRHDPQGPRTSWSSRAASCARMAAPSSPAGPVPSARSTSASASSDDEKDAIGRAAAAMVVDGESIALDASTTALAMARHLKARGGWLHLTVITNGLRIAAELAGHPGITVAMPAGFVRWEALSLVGPLSEGLFDKVNIQRAFMGAAGFALEAGLTDATEEEAQIKRLFVTAPPRSSDWSITRNGSVPRSPRSAPRHRSRRSWPTPARLTAWPARFAGGGLRCTWSRPPRPPRARSSPACRRAERPIGDEPEGSLSPDEVERLFTIVGPNGTLHRVPGSQS